jgi:hypothetical protein
MAPAWHRALTLGVVVVACGAACGGLEDTRPATWSFIAPMIIQPNCATSTCHSRAAAVAGLDLSTAKSAQRSLDELHVILTKKKKIVMPSPDESPSADAGASADAEASTMMAGNELGCDMPLPFPEDDMRLCYRKVPRKFVTPYNPDESRLVHMLRARQTRRMPPDRPLSEADILLIERWILNGAFTK